MQTKREIATKKIAERLSSFSSVVTFHNKVGYTDINKSSERFFIDILNTVYSLSLVDMNNIQSNYPAIDLGDYTNRVCIQVTSDSTADKFRETVRKFKEKNLSQYFDSLVFLVISKKGKTTVTDTSLKTSIKNLDDLFSDCTKLNDGDLFFLDSYIDANLISSVGTRDSILPPPMLHSYSIPTPTALIKYLKLEGEQESISQLEKDIKSLSMVLLILTKPQRELIYFIMANGKFPETIYGYSEHTVIMTTNQISQTFGRIKARELMDVVMSYNLIRINDEYDPNSDGRFLQVAELYYRKELEDGNLFSFIKGFCHEDLGAIYKIIVECDFSKLAA